MYLAVDQRLGSAVAIKRTLFAGDELLGNAFEREARVLARLRHPVLPKVSDHFTENDQQFLVMEHISGEDLSKRLEALQKPFPLSWVMFWADQLLDALSYLHSHEPPIIHRDIKPQNLKLTDENHIVLLDFGLSKSSTGQTNLASGVGPTGSTGSVVGYTPHYAPMEQIRGIGTSPRSDLYSLSATIYQLMTNVVPGDALTRADVMLNGLPDPITPIHELNPEVPPAVSAVVLRGMEVSQDKRFDSAREMQKTLRKAFAEMQQAMSAKTVAISGSDTAAGELSQLSSFDATEVMDPEALRAISNPIGGSRSGFSENISQPNSPHSNMEATVAFDPPAITGTSGLKQSDVKTEVYTGANSLPLPTAEEPQPFASVPTPSPTGQENFALTTDYSSLDSAGAETFVPSDNSYSRDATAANAVFQENGAAAIGDAGQFGGYHQSGAVPVGFDSRPQRHQAVVDAVPAKKGSAGKVAALLGGLFLFFVVVLAAGGGGYYYYTNYAGSAAPTPSPTPLPTVEPSPAPTSESVFAENSNTASPTPSETPEPSSSPTVLTPEEPQVDRPDSRPTPLGAKPTPRPRPSSSVKPAPTKKPGGRDPDILQ